MFPYRILITGSDDLASATALRLFRSGFKVALLAPDRPIDIHHIRTFSSAVYNGEKTIEQVTACTRSGSVEKGDNRPETTLNAFLEYTFANRRIPVLTEEDFVGAPVLNFDYIFLAVRELFKKLPGYLKENSILISKWNDKITGLSRYQICDDSIYRGRVIYPFNKERFVDCGKLIKETNSEEKVKAPLEGVFTTNTAVDSIIHEKQELGRINDIPILAPCSGKISGLLNSGLIIPAGTVFAEICSVTNPEPVKLISAASFSVAGAVLEAILYDLSLNENS